MKNFTFLFFMASLLFTEAQISTGQVTLTSGYSVQFDVDGSTSTVTMTMIGPSNVWLGVALNTQTGNGMGFGGEDVILYANNQLIDASLTGSNAQPDIIESQDWSVSSNTVSGGVRTLVATRSLNTFDSVDYVFTTSTSSFPMLWAKGSGSNLNYHGSNRGGVVATLSTDKYQAPKSFSVFPNPASDVLNISFPENKQVVHISVFDVLGKLVYKNQISRTRPQIDINGWSPGLYLMQIKTETAIETKQIIKQ